MIVVIDSNILFSICIAKEKPDNRLSEILFNPFHRFEWITCAYALTELSRHQDKLLKISKLPVKELGEYLHGIFKRVDIFKEEAIEKSHWQEAIRLTTGIDIDDVPFVALALQTGGTLWTGDKKLRDHLKTMGFERIVSTAELSELLEIG